MERGDLTGAILDGRYRVIEPVAQGGMGTVYRAERVKLGRIVAVKVLHEVLPHELSARKRFEIEAMAMAKLEHPHCASVLDVGVHDERPYVVMDFVSGGNLKDLIAAGPVAIPRAAEIVRQVLSGLAHAHELGIIHRDIKPANLVLSQKTGLGDHVKILDFGLARLSDAGQNLTTGVVVGTPAYMAPEQIRGQPLDARADLYACGVLLFELVTARKPFHSEADDPIEVCRMHLSAPIPRLADRRPGVDFGELEPVVARALAKAPGDRYASAQAFAAALEAAVPRRPSRPVISPEPPRGVPGGSPAGSPAGSPGGSIARSIELGAGDLLAVSGASSPPDVEIRTGDVIASFPDAVPAPPAQAEAIAPVDAEIDPRDATRGGVNGPALPVQRGRESPLSIEASAPGTFFGRPVRAPTPVPREAAPPARAGRPARWRRRAAIAGAVAIVAAAGVVAVTRLGASGSGGPSDAGERAEIASGSSAAPDPARDIIERASELAGHGDRNAALELLHRSRRQYPDSGALAFAAGRIYFSEYYWTEGLKSFREAIRSDPAYRTDPELIKIVLRGFITTPGYNEDLASFLRDDIGSAAQPFLEETARDHPNPLIRSRVAAELRRYH